MEAHPDPVESEDPPDHLDYAASDDSDFQAPLPVPEDNSSKRSRMEEESESQEDEEDTTVCDICQKEWVNNGFHSIAQMKCGHCFGKSYVVGGQWHVLGAVRLTLLNLHVDVSRSTSEINQRIARSIVLSAGKIKATWIQQLGAHNSSIASFPKNETYERFGQPS